MTTILYRFDSKLSAMSIDVCMIQMKFCKVIRYKYMIIRNIIPDLYSENQSNTIYNIHSNFWNKLNCYISRKCKIGECHKTRTKLNCYISSYISRKCKIGECHKTRTNLMLNSRIFESKLLYYVSTII